MKKVERKYKVPFPHLEKANCLSYDTLDLLKFK